MSGLQKKAWLMPKQPTPIRSLTRQRGNTVESPPPLWCTHFMPAAGDVGLGLGHEWQLVAAGGGSEGSRQNEKREGARTKGRE